MKLETKVQRRLASNSQVRETPFASKAGKRAFNKLQSNPCMGFEDIACDHFFAVACDDNLNTGNEFVVILFDNPRLATPRKEFSITLYICHQTENVVDGIGQQHTAGYVVSLQSTSATALPASKMLDDRQCEYHENRNWSDNRNQRYPHVASPL